MASMVQDKDLGYKEIMKDIDNISGMELSVGVLRNAGKDKNGTDLVDIALYNEYGTRHIPSRPFMRIAADENSNKWQEHAAKAVDAVIAQKLEPAKAVELVANEMVGDIQQVIGNRNKLEANAPSTIKQKGSDAPLIDTRQIKTVYFF